MPLNPPDITELRAILDWVNLTDDVRELTIKFGDVELFISRDRSNPDHAPSVAAPAAGALASAGPAIAAPAAVAAPPALAAPEPAATVASRAAGDGLAADEVLVKAPMVGVFYASPKPGDPPFVSVGDAVTPASVVGIVEVMKLMNSLEARISGTIVRILAENEQAVEYGQPLMVIRQDG